MRLELDYHILLASHSPRRRELLSMLELPFTVVSLGEVDESYPADMDPMQVAPYLSQVKSRAYRKVLHDHELLLTADTVVVLGDQILGKPKDEDDAVDMLLRLSDNTHTVVSGVTLATLRESRTFDCRTRVKFGHVSEDEARYYVDTFHPLDKAGAYGVQEWIGAVAVESLDGSYYNVMGLPVHRLYHELFSFAAKR